MGYTIEQYERLKESIALGAVTVQYSDRTITYKSISELEKIKELMEKELFPGRKNPAGNRVQMIFGKGLD